MMSFAPLTVSPPRMSSKPILNKLIKNRKFVDDAEVTRYSVVGKVERDRKDFLPYGLRSEDDHCVSHVKEM